MTEELTLACKRLRLSGTLVTRAKKLKAESHLEFLLKLFNSEIAERELRRRNACIKTAKFDLLKTFEKYTFEDIKNAYQ